MAVNTRLVSIGLQSVYVYLLHRSSQPVVATHGHDQFGCFILFEPGASGCSHPLFPLYHPPKVLAPSAWNRARRLSIMSRYALEHLSIFAAGTPGPDSVGWMFDVSGDAGASPIPLSHCYIYPAKRTRSTRLNITREVL